MCVDCHVICRYDEEEVECLVGMLGVRKEGMQRRQVQKSGGCREKAMCENYIRCR